MLYKNESVFNPQYSNLFYQDASKCCYQEVVRGKEYSTELPVNLKLINKLKQNQDIAEDAICSPLMSRKSLYDVSGISHIETS
jgi:hypothetical protein